MAQQPVDLPVASVSSDLEAVALSHDEEDKASRIKSSFFRGVEEGNVQLLHIILKTHSVDISAHNDEGMTDLHLAVYKFDIRKRVDDLEFLVKHGADVCLKAISTPHSRKLSIVRQGHDASLETKKISYDQKTPLLLALELKSALYLKGLEYRHWDEALKLLAGATSKALIDRGVHEQGSVPNIEDTITKGWESVFESGNHSMVELYAEGKEIKALKLLLIASSKKFKHTFETMVYSSNTLELKEVSFTIAKAMLKFIYTGSVDPQFMGQRGIDLLQAAHKYGVGTLKALCEVQIQPTQETWIKLLTVAGEVNSDLLALKCARSIEEVMSQRHQDSHILLKSFSESNQGGPHQLFGNPHYA